MLALGLLATQASAAPPTAQFDASQTVACATPATVFFTDLSTVPLGSPVIDSWAWDFGDGGSSAATNPIHTYAAGTFAVVLTVGNADGTDVSDPTTISVVQTVPSFTLSTPFGCGPLTVDFTDTTTTTGTLTEWSWDFGDGQTSATQNPSHTYDAPGTYTVSLTVHDGVGCGGTATQSNAVQVIGPVPDFSVDSASGPAPHAAAFTDLTTFGAPLVAWSWQFGDGSTATAQHPSHVYPEPGTYDVTLEVGDLDGCSRSLTKPGFVTVTAAADLGVTLSDGVATAFPGDTLTYLLVAANVDTSGDPAATLQDTFPAELACSWTSVAAGGAGGNGGGSGDLAETLTLPAASSVTYTVTCDVAADALGDVSNTATVTSSGTDPVLANNSATDTTEIVSPATLSATKTVSGLFEPGGEVLYILELANAGPATQLDNSGDELTDVLPPEAHPDLRQRDIGDGGPGRPDGDLERNDRGRRNRGDDHRRDPGRERYRRPGGGQPGHDSFRCGRRREQRVDRLQRRSGAGRSRGPHGLRGGRDHRHPDAGELGNRAARAAARRCRPPPSSAGVTPQPHGPRVGRRWAAIETCSTSGEAK